MVNEITKDIPSVESMRLFRNKIIRWFNSNKRTYPWRETDDPFKVLIAEIMLRRTKADQVKMVYTRLFEKYPDIKSLAEAEDEKVQKILYPLGLKWRLPAILLVARELREKFHCRVPKTREELKTLTGVGEYVAGAVASIAYNKNEWIVDSNIVRLFKRYFGVRTSREGRRDKHVKRMAETYISEGNPKQDNLALLDLTALICTPRNPRCHFCPLISTCCYHSVTAKKGELCLD